MSVPNPLLSLSERLRDRTTLRYTADCKCGNCQLVDRPLLDESISALARASVLIPQLYELILLYVDPERVRVEHQAVVRLIHGGLR